METPDGMEPFQSLHGKDHAAPEVVAAEVAAKEAAFQWFLVIEPQYVPA